MRILTYWFICISALAPYGFGQVAAPGRVNENLKLYYTFFEGTGSITSNVAKSEMAVPLTMNDTSKVAWLKDGGIRLKEEGAILQAGKQPLELYSALAATNQLTVECWVKAENLIQDGPARLISYSKDKAERNFTLGTDEDTFVIRLRTPGSGLNGSDPQLKVPGVLSLNKQHLAFTFDGSLIRAYVNGVLQSERLSLDGGFANWDPTQLLQLGNETDLARQWLGDIYLVAIYDRALSPVEMKRNFDAGLPVKGVIPKAPVAVRAGPLSSSKISVAWQDSSSNEDGFRILRSLNRNSNYSVIRTVPANTDSIVDSGLSQSTSYFYRVLAFNASGESNASPPVLATTPISLVVPAAPQSPVATPLTSSSVRVTWQDKSDNEKGFRVYRSLFPNRNYKIVHTLPENAVAVIDTGLSKLTTYYYKIMAFNDIGESVPSSVVVVKTFDEAAPPAPPENPVASALSAEEVQIRWKRGSDNEKGFRLLRSQNSNSGYKVVKELPAGTIKTVDRDLEQETTYYYRVVAFNDVGESSPSVTVFATTERKLTAPVTPKDPFATTLSATIIQVGWKNSSDNEEGFRLLRSRSANSGFSVAQELAADAVLAVETGLEENTTYYYRVVAFNAAGESRPSATVFAKTLPLIAIPEAPEDGEATPLTSSTMKIEWQDKSDNEDGFRLLRSRSSSRNFEVVQELGVNVTTTIDSGLSARTTYYYRVLAFNGTGESEESRRFSARTLKKEPVPNAPDDLIATPVSGSTVELRWDDNSDDEASFRILRSRDSLMTKSTVLDVNADKEKTTDIDLEPNTTYFYVVYAINPGGQSAQSNIARAKTLPAITALPAPGSLQIANATDSDIYLIWKDNSEDEAGFAIERRQQSTVVFTEVDRVGADINNFHDEGLNAQTTYVYRLRAFNEDGFSLYSPPITITTLPARDTNAPLVVLAVSDQTAIASTSTRIAVNIFDDIRVQSADLFYRRGGDTDFKKVTMTGDGSSGFEALIDDADVGLRGLNYYIRAFDGENFGYSPATDYATNPHFLKMKFNAYSIDTTAVSISSARYKFFSIPVELENAAPLHAFEDDLGPYNKTEWRLFTFDASSQQFIELDEIESLEPGKAYWYITRKENTVIDTGPGLSFMSNVPFEIELKKGWNDFANPFAFPVNWQDVTNNDSAGDNLVGPYTYNNGWELPDANTILQPGEAYSIYSHADDITLSIPARSTDANSMSLVVEDDIDWQLKLSAWSEGMGDMENYIGQSPAARAESDKFDYLEPHAVGQNVSLSFPRKAWRRAGDYARDIRGDNGHGEKWPFTIKAERPGEKVQLKISGLAEIPSNYRVQLVDHKTGRRIELHGDYEATLNVGNSGSRKFTIFSGTTEFLQEMELDALVPESFEVFSNYPNPFNGGTKISYSTPDEGHVKVTVFDITGRSIKVLFAGLQDAGYHTLQWDGSNERGVKVGSGIYFVRFHFGETSKSQKITYIR